MTLDAETDMPSAPLTVADTLDLPGLAYAARTAATRSFGRRPDEVPAARRFIREALDGHPAAFDAELRACELVTNTGPARHRRRLGDHRGQPPRRHGARGRDGRRPDRAAALARGHRGGRGRPRLPARQRDRAALGVPPRAGPHLHLLV